MATSPTRSAGPPRPTKASGPYLYRYASLEHSNPSQHIERLEWLKTIMLKHQVYVPDLTQLNDPADCRPRLARLSELAMSAFFYPFGPTAKNPRSTLSAQVAEGVILTNSIRAHGPETLMRRFKRIYDAEMSSWKIYCLTKRYGNMSMWAKYADAHHGYCLEFANAGDFFGRAFEVVYAEFPAMDVTNENHINANWFFCKAPQWSNEEEVRVLVPRQDPHNVTINPNSLTRIILGWQMPESDQRQIREWAKERKPELTVVAASWDDFDQVLNLIA